MAKGKIFSKKMQRIFSLRCLHRAERCAEEADEKLAPRELCNVLSCDDRDARKHRLAGKRFGWFVHDWRILKNYGVVLDGLPERLAAEYCPGALTIIAPCKNGTTQGFRVPDVPLLLELLNKTASPLLQTSANASGMPDARSCDEALAQLDGEVDCAVDGGTIPVSAMASTVVDAVGEKIKILRQGGLDLQKWL